MKNTHDLNSVLLSKKVGGRNKQETANAGGIGKDIRHQSGHDVYLAISVLATAVDGFRDSK